MRPRIHYGLNFPINNMNFFVILLCVVIQRTASVNYTYYESDPNEVNTFEDREPKLYYPYEYERYMHLDARAQEFAAKIQFKYYKLVLFISII